MAPIKPHELIYDTQVFEHVARIERKYHSLIRREIEKQLAFEPDTETRNRKPLSRPSVLGSAWELRCGPGNRFRVFYRTDREAGQVHILAIGEKTGNVLRIGGKEFRL